MDSKKAYEMIKEDIIDKELYYEKYKNDTIKKADTNYLYKIDKEDKQFFKNNEEDLNNDKIQLELMILKFLTTI